MLLWKNTAWAKPYSCISFNWYDPDICMMVDRHLNGSDLLSFAATCSWFLRLLKRNLRINLWTVKTLAKKKKMSLSPRMMMMMILLIVGGNRNVLRSEELKLPSDKSFLCRLHGNEVASENCRP